MILATLSAVIALSSAPMIESASGDWSNIPHVPSATPMILGTAAMKGIDRAVAQGKCPRIGSKRHINLELPVLVQFEGEQVRKVVVSKIGCPEVEEIVGNATWQSAAAGRFKPSGINKTGWYRSEVSYLSTD